MTTPTNSDGWKNIRAQVDKIIAEQEGGQPPSIRKLAKEVGVPYETLRQAWERQFGTPLSTYAQLRKNSENSEIQSEILDKNVVLTSKATGLDNLSPDQGPDTDVTEIDFSVVRSLDYVMTALGISAAESVAYIQRLRAAGRNLTEVASGHWIEVNRVIRNEIQVRPLSEGSHHFRFGTWSDLHAGSVWSQPTAFNQFVDHAVALGVTDFLCAGDITDGIFGFPGHNLGLVPLAQAPNRGDTRDATRYQALLASRYIPRRDGVRHYVIGGNHDMWHITKSSAGSDVFRTLTAIRDDIVFLGYDEADVPLTHSLFVTLWHPGGGVSAASTSSVQRSLATRSAQRKRPRAENRLMIALLAGHYHTEGKTQVGNVLLAQLGCFQSQTDFLKRGSLFPMIGGGIWDIDVDASGNLLAVAYQFYSYPEIEKDYLNFPLLEDYKESIPLEPQRIENPIQDQGT